jgi:alkaline phosphatase
MVPDGMGLAYVTAARIKKSGVDGPSLFFERLARIGYQRTHSANSLVTDSAAAASAWSTGEKFRNGEIAQHGKGGAAPQTILELAKTMGKATGLVVTSTLTHATPAAFGAHVHHRRCEHEIARQMISVTGVDVLLGGGKHKFRSVSADPCGTSGDFIALAKTLGYRIAYTRDRLLSLNNPPKVLGLFAESGMLPVSLLDGESAQPTLAEMTRKALEILELNDNGFFLMVEGSQIDWAGHANDFGYLVKEMLEFNRSVKVVMDWLKASGRSDETLIIVAPDHETGGLAINGPYGAIPEKRGDSIEAGWTTVYHTAVDTLIWSGGPYSEYLGFALDNTQLFHVMKAAFLGIEPELRKPEY